ncbi:laminin subunit gamma-3 [Plakobranchus ocellatus]|uniref:Laminin subunit gamma-3 n=1 Tax=Plakobranchus ocellatus TaxID=259542 RepID=A0AAV4A7C5_9GAST|nr:laminin subunit gamma-3 [Plakobranchus ocellatus]
MLWNPIYVILLATLGGARSHDSRTPADLRADSLANVPSAPSRQADKGRHGRFCRGLTILLQKSFEITYVNLRFYSPRPESFAIYKRSREDGPWEPYQFYSGSCEKTYGLPRNGILTESNEDQAVCTKEFSGISPLTGGSVAFSTLEGRPSMFNFNHSPKLQQWVTATDIRIVLTRMNTFGDEVFGDEKVLKSYYYAISDLAVGARCKCNGHARSCARMQDPGMEDRLRCECEHNTMGVDCEQCKPFFNDQPWGRATERNAHECKPCECNGLSDTCEFDPDLYRQTGHGGRCTNCRDNTDGINCELCKRNFWRRGQECIACGCDPTGSLSLQCDERGQCRCKPGVGGERCDRCLPNYYDFSDGGCVPCECEPSGSLDNEPNCDSGTGLCQCKENVDGRRCDKCKPGYFGLNPDDPFGCTSCFCYGHSSECSSARGYHARNITSDFATGNQGWTGITRGNREVDIQYNGITQNIGASSENDMVYFLAPARYLGDQRFSYNQYLTFDLRIGEESPRPSRVDIVLEGGNQQKVETHIFAQRNPVPTIRERSFAFRIHEHPTYQWSPKVEAVGLISILSNLTAVKIRATYNENGVGFIDNIELGTASQGLVPGQPEARWVEQCQCPEGYIGQFCESCTQGYKRDPPNSGSFARCVPCECNGHSESCDTRTGRCICRDNTDGDFCERCARGFYGDATAGTADDCQPCPCPNGGPCIQLPNSDVVCTECEEGYGGNLCDVCLDGYYGDPLGDVTGQPTPCRRCICSGNIDPNAIRNCETVTGECLKCTGNTGGFSCEQCLPNYYNNSAGECTACNCYYAGTVSQPGASGCDQTNGQCLCLPNVIGRQCDMCASGYWNLASGEGCEPCDCDRVGSTNYTCEEASGQCACKDGVSGRKCDACSRYYYGFSDAGCTACNCDPIGSTDLHCDANGRCPCKENVAGRRCDRCMENKYDISAGCLDCPQCYNLVQRQVNAHRAKLRELTLLIEQTADNPSLFNDSSFVEKLSAVNESVNLLLDDARGANTGNGMIGQELDALRSTLNDLMDKLKMIASNIAKASQANEDSQADILQAEQTIDAVEKAWQAAKNYIDKEGRMALNEAQKAFEISGRSSEQMTEIARKAAALAANQTEEAQLIEDLAIIALNTSQEANRLAMEAFEMPDKTKEEIDRLEKELMDAESLYQNTKMHANSTYQKAKAAQEEALSLLHQADKQLPSLDVDALKNEAQEIKDKAADIMERAEKLSKENMELMSKVSNQTDTANDLLMEGDLVNKNISNLLAEADYARSEARKAIEAAKKTLKEANDTLRTLEEFDELVGKEDAANQAMDQVPEIKMIIEEARNTTRMAEDALSGVAADAQQALKLAEEAEATANMASKDAGDIRTKAEDTKNKANMLRDDAEELAGEVEKAESSLDTFEAQVSTDENSAKQALKAAAQAKTKAQDAYEEVTKSHALVLKIKDSLKDMGSIDMNQLMELEALLDKVDKEIMDADVDGKVQDLEERKAQIESQADKFDLDLTELLKDVENIREIKDSLPDGCFKTIPIEYKPES